MNRHHYSLYVHNCRLILLLRQDPSEAENYKPAEFHWKLDQVSPLLLTEPDRTVGFEVILRATFFFVSHRHVTKSGITMC